MDDIQSSVHSRWAETVPEISVVVPLYDEGDNIPELHRRLTAVLTALEVSYELVFVNDGSKDATPELLNSLQRQDPRLVAVHLSRNFGHQPAISAGIDQARGRAVIVMDGDLQDPPEVLGQFIAAWRQGSEVVYAMRTKRKEGLLKRAGYALFYRLLRRISDLDIPLDSGDFCLMDRKVVEVMKHLPEKTRFVRGLRTFVGFRQLGIPLERAARAAGQPKYTFRALCRLAVDGLVSFSSFPLTLVTYFGLCAAGLAFVLMIWGLVDAFVIKRHDHADLRHGLGPPRMNRLDVVHGFISQMPRKRKPGVGQRGESTWLLPKITFFFKMAHAWRLPGLTLPSCIDRALFGSVSVCRLSLRERPSFRGAKGDNAANRHTTSILVASFSAACLTYEKHVWLGTFP